MGSNTRRVYKTELIMKIHDNHAYSSDENTSYTLV